MLTCPFCGVENIDGADVCDECQQPIDFLSRPHAHSPTERSLLRGTVSMLRPRTPQVVTPATPASEVLRMLVDRSIGCVVVADDELVVGIFSERDALLRLNVDAARLADQPISNFMTPSPETVDSDAQIAFALHKMDVGGYRHLPVLTDGRISGMISIRDILAYITDGLSVDHLTPAEAQPGGRPHPR